VTIWGSLKVPQKKRFAITGPETLFASHRNTETEETILRLDQPAGAAPFDVVAGVRGTGVITGRKGRVISDDYRRKQDRFTGERMGQAGDGGPPHPGLTRRQRDIVCFCTDNYQRHGYPPTLREIGAAVGLKSTSSVDYQVRELQRKGYLSRPGGLPGG
jgi:hypothetical protein